MPAKAQTRNSPTEIATEMRSTISPSVRVRQTYMSAKNVIAETRTA
ncbi:MAG: hypothetical protein HZB15_18515 [Actinobacteria bacterium]|nr:hypothetical protein [Actinomycetota bacterium]